MGNVSLTKPQRVSPFRKVAIGSWVTAYDPTVYGTMKVRMEKAEAYIEAFREATGKRLTVTHLVTAAVARALGACPDANAILRWNKIYIRDSVDISILVVIPNDEKGGVDLSAAMLRGADKMSLADQIQALEDQVQGIRSGADKQMQKTKDSLKMIPFMLMNFFLNAIAFLTYDLNLNLSFLGLPRDPFGGATITNVGSLGLDTAYVPLVPYTRVPIFVAPGMVKDEPVVDDGKVVPGRTLSINASFDHRFIDGYHASVLSRTLRRVLENPFEELDPLPARAGDRP